MYLFFVYTSFDLNIDCRLGWKYGLAFVPEDNYCRKVRRLMRRFMTSQAMAQHRPILYETAQEMIDGLKRSPEAFEEHIHK